MTTKASAYDRKILKTFEELRPMGAYVDPEKMIATRKVGKSPWELRERAFAGEFAPLKPYDPRMLL
jgi:hypothetical protein